MQIQGVDLKMWSGFKASAFQSELGVTLAIDNIFKFMSTTTCLDRIYEIKRECHSEHQWQQAVKLEFNNRSIIADWGNRRTYRVDDVDFEVTPLNHEFIWNGENTKLARYFEVNYNKVVTNPHQPCFLVKMGEQQQYLPAEFCLLDGVPDSIRKSAGMRNALAATRISPSDKLRQV